MLTDRHHNRLAASVYGRGEHHCAHCDASRTELTEASARQARMARGIVAGDLLCPACDRALTLDALAADEMVLDAETQCAEPDLAPLPWELSYEPAAVAA